MTDDPLSGLQPRTPWRDLFITVLDAAELTPTLDRFLRWLAPKADRLIRWLQSIS